MIQHCKYTGICSSNSHLTSERPDGNTAFSYDSLGNRIQTDDGQQTTQYSHNKLNQYDSVDSVAYSYDENGNLANDGFYKYYYDCENRLTDVNYVSNNQRVAQYKYDWLGRRVKKIDYTQKPVRSTLYCYDGDWVPSTDDIEACLKSFGK
ncbi:MAG: hypothetical protein JW804_05480 [Sedimentisphaerales bacterium]|nr:hypothetical protein [Sedimentisphaerales bacterium]